jgi:hypothetical protein
MDRLGHAADETVLVATQLLELQDKSPEREDESETDSDTTHSDASEAMHLQMEESDVIVESSRFVLSSIGSSTSRLTSVSSELNQTVLVRLFHNARDWQYVRQANVCYSQDGGLDLREVSNNLDVAGECRVGKILYNQKTANSIYGQVIDPVNGRPFYLYNGDIIDSLEVQQLLEQDGYLRIVRHKGM